MPIPNNTIEFLTSERNKQTPPYHKFYDMAIAALEMVNSFQNGKSCGAEGGTFQNGNDHSKKEYIEREALIDEVNTSRNQSLLGKTAAGKLIKFIKNIPAANVVEVMGSGWISVEDRLPECNDNEGVEVIAFIKGTKTVTAVYYSDGEFFDEAKDYYNVTHWMPMPEPPKGEQGSNA